MNDKQREAIEKILDKHTKFLTKTTEGNCEFVSFDTVVIDKYEATNDLVELMNEARAEGVREAIENMNKLLPLGQKAVYNSKLGIYGIKLQEKL